MEYDTTKDKPATYDAAHENDILLHITHGGSTFDLVVSSNDTIEQLQQTLHEITSISIDKQKLLWKGMKRGATRLNHAGLKNGSKITIIGTPEKAIELMHKSEAEAARRADILRARESRGPTKVSKSLISHVVYQKITSLIGPERSELSDRRHSFSVPSN
jgi:hypothetical protein